MMRSPCTDSSRATTLESGATTLAPSSEIVVASAAGSYSSCDVWFHVPPKWTDRVTLRLYARLGASRVLVRQVSLGRVPTTGGEGGAVSGLAMSLRGRPSSAFELTVQASDGPDLSGGLFYLQLWHAAVAPSSAGGDAIPETPTSLSMVAAAILGRDTSGNLREITVDEDGRLLAASGQTVAPSKVEHVVVAGSQGTSEATFKRIGGIELAVPAGYTARFIVRFETSGPTSLAEVRLYDVNDAQGVPGSGFETYATQPETLTAELSLSPSLKSYEVHIRVTQGDPAARAICTRAVIQVEPSES